MSQAVCAMMEEIVAGAKPACRLSRRAEAALAQIRDRLAFVDGYSLPVVSDGGGRVVIWAFAGTAATASIAAGLALQGFIVLGFDDLAITLRASDPEKVAKALRGIDPVSIHPKLPEDLGQSLKFGLCLPAEVIGSVLKARTADAATVVATCRRSLRLVYTAQLG
jgi:ATP-dependent Lhr-like helicase